MPCQGLAIAAVLARTQIATFLVGLAAGATVVRASSQFATALVRRERAHVQLAFMVSLRRVVEIKTVRALDRNDVQEVEFKYITPNMIWWRH